MNLPSFAPDAVAVLAVDGPRAVPVSGVVLAGDRTILASVRGDFPLEERVALAFQGFTAYGIARLVTRGSTGFVTVEITVTDIRIYQDNGGLDERLGALQRLAVMRRSCRAAHSEIGFDRSSSATT